MIDAGNYMGKPISVVVEKGDTGTSYVAVKFFISQLSVERTIFIYLTEKSMKHSAKKLEALGFNGDFVVPEVSSDEIELSCSHDNYQGKDTERWDLVRWGGGFGEPIDKKTATKLSALYKKEIGNKPVPEEKPKKKEPKIEDDEEEDLRSKAWNKFIKFEKLEDKSRRDQVIEWSSKLVEFNPDKDEADFTDADWNRFTKWLNF